VATPAELARRYTRLTQGQLEHLQRLMATWGMLADLCFSDLLLFVPVVRSEGDGGTDLDGCEGGRGLGSAPATFVVLGQMRPSTSRTLHQEDLVGRVVTEGDWPLLARAWSGGRAVEGELLLAERSERARVQCIPVRRKGRILAVLARESALTVGRRPGELERVYVSLFQRFATMLEEGTFPFEGTPVEESPRVGDGVIVLDAAARVAYASPNAVNALHRMGVYTNAQGRRLGELGVDEKAVQDAFGRNQPATEEVEKGTDVTVLLRCIPLLANGTVTGGVVLLRDVTDLRHRDRLLLSKDATIREVHHRVKNNLQTISSLLRLQARRLGPGEAASALLEAERRVRSIAVVHEVLSREVADQVSFDEIARSLVRTAEDVAARPVRFLIEGSAGELPAGVATPLALVVAELLQNAVRHAFGDGEAPVDAARPVGTVRLLLTNDGRELTVVVADDGRGLPQGFDMEATTSLGLSIVRDLVTSQLGGTISMTETGRGTSVTLRIPVGE
jgi:two-component sensor histidine kinase